MAAFVAQNIGANRYDRAKKALLYAIGVSAALAVVMFAVTFFYGSLLSGIFANDTDVIHASADYLKAYAIDCPSGGNVPGLPAFHKQKAYANAISRGIKPLPSLNNDLRRGLVFDIGPDQIHLWIVS